MQTMGTEHKAQRLSEAGENCAEGWVGAEPPARLLSICGFSVKSWDVEVLRN